MKALRAGGNFIDRLKFFDNDRVMLTRGFLLGVIERNGELDHPKNQNPLEILESWLRLLQGTDSKGLHLAQYENFFRAIHLDLWEKLTFPDPKANPAGFENLCKTTLRALVEGGARRGCYNKRFFMLDNGRMGLAPPRAQEGDSVCISHGGHTPIFLRDSVRSNGRHNFIGECFVLDFMDGEIIDMHNSGKAELAAFYLE
jgi:hypothetical protein